MTADPPTPRQAFTFTNPQVPDDYVCGDCGVRGTKLWRESATFHIQLVCGACLIAGRARKDERGPIDALGRHEAGVALGMGRSHPSVQYFGWVPAVPAEDGSGYYWVTTVPPEGFTWWQALPSMPLDPTDPDARLKAAADHATPKEQP